MRVTAIFVGAKLELATISSPVPNDVLSRWLQMNEFQALPDTVMSEKLIRQSGFRPKQIILVTTLLDPKRYPKAKLLSSIICAGKRRKSISSTSNHVKHGDDLGKITADGTKGNRCIYWLTICCET